MEPRDRRAGKLGPWAACALVLFAGVVVISVPMLKEAARPKVGECLAAGPSPLHPSDEVVACGVGAYEIVVSRDFTGSGGDVCRQYPEGVGLVVGWGKGRALWEVCAVAFG